MKKEKSIQADIWFIKGILQNEYQENDNSPLTPRGLQEKQSLERIISSLEAMRDAGDMLPCKKPHLGWCGIHLAGSCTCGLQDREEMLALCTPVVAKLLEENKGLPIEYREIKKLEKENKELHKRLNDWIYELAYYTEDEVATPVGVKKFVGKAIEDKVKEIKELREEIKDRAGTEKSLTAWVNELGEENDSLKLAQPNALKASEVKPKPLSKEKQNDKT